MCGVDQVWCLSSSMEQRDQINRTVDGAVLSILLTGLLPDIRYTVVVAAVTRLGVGAESPPVSLLLSESLKLLQLVHVDKQDPLSVLLPQVTSVCGMLHLLCEWHHQHHQHLCF